MKKALFASLGIAAILLGVYTQLPEANTDLPKPEMKKGLYPNEWAYNQRAYPHQVIDKKEAKKALDDFQILKTAKSGSVGEWENHGPENIGGRITDISISPTDDNTFYVGTAQGGVFKTTDAGENWSTVFDGVTRGMIGDVTVAPSNDQRIYVGTGEANASGTSGAFFGDGVWTSADAGATWTNIGLENSQHIARILVDPEDEDRLFVAATGTLYGTGTNRGVYKTEDGGSNWEQMLFVTDSTACTDLIMHPTDHDTLYAAMWERRRYPWQRDYAGVSSGVYRTYDGGENWELLTNGIPNNDENLGRIGLALSESEPNVIYATVALDPITNQFGGLYRSTDFGDSWDLVILDDLINVYSSFGWYFGNLRVHPEVWDDVHVLGQSYVRVTDNATSWTADGQMHVDFHAMEFGNQNTDMILCGNDGGLYISMDNGENWSHFQNMPITQFYQIEVSESAPEVLLGGTQDNNTLTNQFDPEEYTPILGGDGFHVEVDPIDANYVYAEYQWGNFFRSEDGGLYMSYATPYLDETDRTNWNTPFIVSKENSEVLYYGSNRVWRSDDRAVTWYPISDDLSDGPHPSGSLSYGTLTTLAASEQTDGVVYTGTDDGNVHVTFDNGASWSNISNGLPDRYVTGLAIDPADDMTAYVTFSGYGFLDFNSHIFKTTDGGQNWVGIAGNLPAVPINDVLIQANPFRLFITTDVSVFFSDDDGLNWDILGTNLPLLSMTHLQYHEGENKIYTGTFGRSIFSYDLGQLPVVGIAEYDEELVSLYPNPAQDVLNLESKYSIESYTIYNDKGQQVMTKRTQQARFVQIDVRTLPSGRYTIVTEGDAKERTQSFIKIH